MDIKVLTPAPTSHFTNTAFFFNWKFEKINAEKIREIHKVLTTTKKMKKKHLKLMKIITFMNISSAIKSLVFTL